MNKSVDSKETVKFPAYNGISLALGDITSLYVDCLVCHLSSIKLAAQPNRGLLGSISKSAGPKFLKDFKEILRKIDIKSQSEVKFTKGFNSRAFEIFHCHGPSINPETNAKESDKHALAMMIENCLDLAVKHNHVSIAFPAMLTGNHKFDTHEGPKIVINTIKSWREMNDGNKMDVYICLFKDRDLKLYREVLEQNGDLLMKDDRICVKGFHGDLQKQGIET